MKQLQEAAKLIFKTNWKTSFCAILIFLAVGLKIAKLINTADMVAIMGVATGSGFLAAKDGVREEQVVAPENTDSNAA